MPILVGSPPRRLMQSSDTTTATVNTVLLYENEPKRERSKRDVNCTYA